MLTKKELDDFIFQKFKLSRGLNISGVDLWNHLIENNAYRIMANFLTISTPSELDETLICSDPLTNGFFGAKIDQLSKRNRNKFFLKLKINKIRVFDFTGSFGETQIINFYGNYWNSIKENWSTIEWVLFSVNLPNDDL